MTKSVIDRMNNRDYLAFRNGDDETKKSIAKTYGESVIAIEEAMGIYKSAKAQEAIDELKLLPMFSTQKANKDYTPIGLVYTETDKRYNEVLLALKELSKQAKILGADAIVGININTQRDESGTVANLTGLSYNIPYVMAYGTAVKYNEP